MKRKMLENFLVAAVLAALAFWVSMSASVNLWDIAEIGTDSGVFRYMALAMSKGEMMYRDCFDHKGPLIYFLNYLGMSISYYRGIWLVELLFLLGSACGIYRIARLRCGKVFSCVTVFVVFSCVFGYFEGGNFTEEYAMPLILWSLYFFLDYFLHEKISGLRVFLCGAMFAGVFLLRANMIALWMVFCLAVLLQKIFQKRAMELLGFVGWFLAGCAVVFVPVLIYLCGNGVFSYFIQDYFLFNFSYSAFGNGPKLTSYITFADSYWMIASFGIMLYVFWTERDGKKRYAYGAYLAFLAASLLLTCLSGHEYAHYGMTLVPAFSFPAAILFAYAKERAQDNKLWYFMVYLCMILLLPPWTETLKRAVESHYYGKPASYGEALERTIDAVRSNSGEDDRITVWGTLCSVYVLSGRLSASRYAYQAPIALVKPEIYDAYFADLENRPPKLVVTSDYYSRKLDASRMRDFLERLHYGMILDAGDLKVYAREEVWK